MGWCVDTCSPRSAWAAAVGGRRSSQHSDAGALPMLTRHQPSRPLTGTRAQKVPKSHSSLLRLSAATSPASPWLPHCPAGEQAPSCIDRADSVVPAAAGRSSAVGGEAGALALSSLLAAAWLLLPASASASAAQGPSHSSGHAAAAAVMHLPPSPVERAGGEHGAGKAAEQHKASLLSLELGLGVSRDQAEALLLREPALSTIPTLQLTARLHSLHLALAPALSPGGQQHPGTHPPPAPGPGPHSSSSRGPAPPAAQPPAPHATAGMQAAVELVLRQPRVLLVPPQETTLRLKALSQLLKVPLHEGSALVARQPGLLTHQPATLSLRLEALGRLLRVTAEGAVRLAAAEPGLLALRHEELAGRFQALSAALGEAEGSTHAALSAARHRPGLMVLRPGQVEERVRGLAQLLKLPPKAAGSIAAQAPRLLLTPPAALSANMAGLADLLGISSERAALLCTEQPLLLTVPPEVLGERFAALTQLLGVPEPELRALAADKPALLTKTSASVRQALDAARASGALGKAEGRGRQ